MTNAYVKLKQILPPAPVLVGLVTAHHEDDTSTVVLPTQEGRIEYAAGVAAGSTIRARGTTVPVGDKAFVRNGVIETRAPDGDAIPIEIGRVVPPMTPLTFNGPIPDQTATVGAAVAVDLTGYWSGGLGALSFSLAAGALPAGLTLSSTGVLSGTPTIEAVTGGLVLRATDTAGYRVDSNAMSFDVAAPLGGLLDTFSSDGELTARVGDSGVTWLLAAAGTLTVHDGFVSQPAGTASYSSPGFYPNPASFTAPSPGQDIYLEGEVEIPTAYGSSASPGFTTNFYNVAQPDRDIRLSLICHPGSSVWYAACTWVKPGGNTSLISAYTAIPFTVGSTLAWRLELRAGSTHGRLLLNGALAAESFAMYSMPVADRYQLVVRSGVFSAPFPETLRLSRFRMGIL